ncbi:MAG: recombinase-like helix-turn-helix domain-containing protein [Pseudomonadota bacterium]
MPNPVHETIDYEHQTRDVPHGDYENRLGDALEALFEAGVKELPDIVAGLNRSGVKPPSDATWTEEIFRAEMARLGA